MDEISVVKCQFSEVLLTVHYNLERGGESTTEAQLIMDEEWLYVSGYVCIQEQVDAERFSMLYTSI